MHSKPWLAHAVEIQLSHCTTTRHRVSNNSSLRTIYRRLFTLQQPVHVLHSSLAAQVSSGFESNNLAHSANLPQPVSERFSFARAIPIRSCAPNFVDCCVMARCVPCVCLPSVTTPFASYPNSAYIWNIYLSLAAFPTCFNNIGCKNERLAIAFLAVLQYSTLKLRWMICMIDVHNDMTSSGTISHFFPCRPAILYTQFAFDDVHDRRTLFLYDGDMTSSGACAWHLYPCLDCSKIVALQRQRDATYVRFICSLPEHRTTAPSRCLN